MQQHQATSDGEDECQQPAAGDHCHPSCLNPGRHPHGTQCQVPAANLLAGEPATTDARTVRQATGPCDCDRCRG